MNFENHNRGFDHQKEHTDHDMVLIQANYDDMNPEWYSYLMDCCFEAGANDVFFQPIIMKKGRPGTMLNVFSHQSTREAIIEIIFRESTTLGVRWMASSCHRLGRSFFEVDTEWGKVKIKAGLHSGMPIKVKPEFDDCERLAREAGVSIQEVFEAAKMKAKEALAKE
jgi:uncharacterized protein (DUF111 family)